MFGEVRLERRKQLGNRASEEFCLSQCRRATDDDPPGAVLKKFKDDPNPKVWERLTPWLKFDEMVARLNKEREVPEIMPKPVKPAINPGLAAAVDYTQARWLEEQAAREDQVKSEE